MFDQAIRLNKTKILPLATIYGLSSLFFLFNFYSLGSSRSFSPIFLFAPLYGLFWIHFESYIIHKITSVNVLELVIRSKTPYFLLLAMWAFLIFDEPFVLNAFAVFMTFLINILSMILLIRSLPFAALRSTITVVTSSISLFVITLIAMFLCRFVYINLHI